MTALDIVTSSLRLIGAISQGESISANEATTVLQVLNDILDLWSTQNLLIPSVISEVFPVVVGQQSYQMGTGAPDFNTARPMIIQNAVWQYNNGQEIYELPIDIISQDEWVKIGVKSTTSNIATKLFIVESFPY